MTDENRPISSDEDDEDRGKLDKVVDVVLELLGLI